MFWNIILGIASYALQLILAPKPQNAKAAALEDFDAPVAEEGLEIPDVFGTEVLRSPNVVWYGDLGIEDIKGARRYGFFGPRQVIGHKYALGMQMVLCSGPADSITEIRVADKVAWSGESTGGQIEIDEPDLLGGDQGEGGIVGAVDVEMGGPTQDANDYLTSAIDGLMPAFRGVVSLVLRQVQLGNNTYIKPWEVTLQRIFKVPGTGAEQWYPATAGIPRSGTLREKRDLSADTAFDERYLDVVERTLVRFNAALTQLIIEDLRTGTALASIAISYDPLWVYMSESTGDVLVPDREGHLYVYDGTDGSLKQDITGWGDPTPAGDPTGVMCRCPTETVVDGVTYLFVQKPTAINFRIVCFSNDGSGWGLQWTSVGQAYTRVISAMSAGPAYLYTISNAGAVFRYEWDSATSANSATHIDLTAFGWDAVSPNGISYSSAGGGSVIVVGSNGWVMVVDEAMETLIGSSDAGTWDGTGGTSGADNLTSNRMLNGSSTAVFYQPHGLYMYSAASGDRTLSAAATEWGYASNYFGGTGFHSGFSAAEQGLVVYHEDGPGAVLFLPRYLDMNPAHIIRECITARMGYLAADIEDDDTDSGFTYAADTLYAELFGLTLKWAREEEIGEFINMVLAHIDAYLYTSRRTGKFNLKLVRNDYDIDEIPVVTEDDVVEWSEVSRRGLADAVNSVTVRYTDRLSRGKDASHQVDNIAQMQQMDGQRVSVTRNYPGISTGNLAVRVARRDVKSLGIGMISGRIVCKRTVESWVNPGEPFRLVSARHNLGGEVMRVAEIEFGDGRDNRIVIKFVQDVFGINDDELVDTAASDWENPANPPQAVSPRLVWEMPYRQLIAFAGTAEANSALSGNPDFGAIEAAGARPTQDTSQAILSVKKNSGSYVDRDVMGFAPAGFLDGEIDEQAATLTLTDASALSLITAGSLAVIDGNDRDLMEVIRIDAVDGLDLDISRGFLDTIPKAHADGAELVVFDDFTQGDGEPYTETDTVSVKLRPTTPLGTLSLSSAPVNTVDMDSRAVRPLRPADCEIDGIGYGTVDASALNPIPVSWARRNRLTETTPLAWDAADVSPEASQTTTIRLLDPAGTVIDDTTYTGIAGTTQDIDPADFGSATSGFIEFVSVRSGYESWQNYRLRVLVATDGLLLEGDEQGGTDVLDLEGDETGDLLLE